MVSRSGSLRSSGHAKRRSSASTRVPTFRQNPLVRKPKRPWLGIGSSAGKDSLRQPGTNNYVRTYQQHAHVKKTTSQYETHIRKQTNGCSRATVCKEDEFQQKQQGCFKDPQCVGLSTTRAALVEPCHCRAFLQHSQPSPATATSSERGVL